NIPARDSLSVPVCLHFSLCPYLYAPRERALSFSLPLFASSHRRSATGAHFSAAGLVLAHKASTSSGANISVDLAPDSFTMALSISGLSNSGQGRKWFSLNGCLLR